MIYFGKNKVAGNDSFETLYPVGSVYITTVNSTTCPITSGTWIKIASSITIGSETVSYWKRTA